MSPARMVSMSAGCSWTAAATSRIFSRISAAASRHASPAMAVPLDAQVPPPNGVVAVSPMTTLISSRAMPSTSEMIDVTTASPPWPWSVRPVAQEMLPSASRRRVQASRELIGAPPAAYRAGLGDVPSTTVARPMPL